MEYLKNLMEKKNVLQLILTLLFIIYLVWGYRMPNSIAEIIDTNSGKIIIFICKLFLSGSIH